MSHHARFPGQPAAGSAADLLPGALSSSFSSPPVSQGFLLMPILLPLLTWSV